MSDRPDLDLSLYLVTDTALAARHPLGIVGIVQAAVAGGATLVQLRDKDVSDDEFVALGRLLVQALRPSGIPLIVNDRVHLVEPIGAAGAHIGQDDLSPTRARELLGPTPYLGLSCTCLKEVLATRELAAGTVDHLGLGPVWNTPTKADHAAALGVEGLRELVGASTLPTVAIGGIDLTGARELGSAGVNGVAVVSAICAADDPEDAARRLRAAWGVDR